MPITLNWNDNNYGEDGYKVYRSSSTMDPSSLPAPLAVLDPNTTEYQDTSTQGEQSYFYRVSAYIGSIEKVSDEITKANVPNFLMEDFEGDLSNWVISNSTIFTIDTIPGTSENALKVLNKSPESTARLNFVSPPTNFKPVEFKLDYYLQTRGLDDCGIITVKDSNSAVTFALVPSRQSSTSSARRLFLNNIDSGFTPSIGILYNITISLDWSLGEVRVVIPGEVDFTTTFDSTLFPVEQFEILSQQGDTSSIYYFDNIEIT